ncbi:unnamed protein product [Urochloa humidicola]
MVKRSWRGGDQEQLRRAHAGQRRLAAALSTDSGSSRIASAPPPALLAPTWRARARQPLRPRSPAWRSGRREREIDWREGRGEGTGARTARLLLVPPAGLVLLPHLRWQHRRRRARGSAAAATSGAEQGSGGGSCGGQWGASGTMRGWGHARGGTRGGSHGQQKARARGGEEVGCGREGALVPALVPSPGRAMGGDADSTNLIVVEINRFFF